MYWLKFAFDSHRNRYTGYIETKRWWYLDNFHSVYNINLLFVDLQYNIYVCVIAWKGVTYRFYTFSFTFLLFSFSFFLSLIDTHVWVMSMCVFYLDRRQVFIGLNCLFCCLCYDCLGICNIYVIIVGMVAKKKNKIIMKMSQNPWWYLYSFTSSLSMWYLTIYFMSIEHARQNSKFNLNNISLYALSACKPSSMLCTLIQIYYFPLVINKNGMLAKKYLTQFL